MAATAKWFGVPVKNLFSATATDKPDWATGTIKISLHTGSMPDQDTLDYQSDLASEVTSSNYTAGGVALTTKTLTYDTASNTVRLKADAASWSNVTFAPTYGVIWCDGAGASSTDPLLGYIDFGGAQSVVAAGFTITPDATDGYLRAVVS